MSADKPKTPVDAERQSKNVKERLNSMLAKKRQDSSEKANVENAEAASAHSKKVEIKEERTEDGNELMIDEKSCDAETSSSESDETYYTQFLLQAVLNEKKRKLLQNPEVIDFLRKKTKSLEKT